MLQASALYSSDQELVERLWAACGHSLYSLGPRERQLGLGEDVRPNELCMNLCLSIHMPTMPVFLVYY